MFRCLSVTSAAVTVEPVKELPSLNLISVLLLRIALSTDLTVFPLFVVGVDNTQRNHRGKVSCKNIKHDCPEPPCSNPVLLPGHCCRSCPKAHSHAPDKKADHIFDGFEYFQEKDDDLHKTYNDRSYLSSEDISQDDSRTDFVALLTAAADSRTTTSSGVACARFTLSRSSLVFSITIKKIGRPSRVKFIDRDGNIVFEYIVPRTASPESNMDPDFAEVLTNLSNREMFWLSRGQLEIAVATEGKNPRRISGYITGKKSCDTIQSVLSSGDALTPTKTGAVGSATFTLHDNGTLEYQIQVAGVASKVTGVTIETKPRRRSRRNVLFDMTADYSEGHVVGTWERLNARDIHMLLQNELFLNVATSEYEEGELRGQISSLLYSGLQARLQELPVPLAGQFVSPPVYTSAAGHVWVSVDENCHLHYEIVVSGLRKSDDVTLDAHLHGFAEIGELDDSSREHKRLLKGFYGSQAEGVLKDLSMELLRHLDKGTAFIQVSTKVNPRGEILGRAEGVLKDLSMELLRHLDKGTAFIQVSTKVNPRGEIRGRAEGVLKDLSMELLRHLDKGTAFIQVSTKVNPRGEIRGRFSAWRRLCSCSSVLGGAQVHVPNSCESGPASRIDDAHFDLTLFEEVKLDPEEIKKDPSSCFFEGQFRTHGSRWAPDYDNKCTVCTCQKRTVICDPIICPVLDCANVIHLEDRCCPVCEEKKQEKGIKQTEKAGDQMEGCYFEGDRKIHPPGTRWHPFVPPFGYIKCAVCTCRGATGEVHCEKVNCPRLTCSNPVRRSPSDCCKECPAEEKVPIDLMEMMQADGPRACKFGKNWYLNNDSWHPEVPPFGEMKCITCWCDDGVTKCQREQCPLLTCSKIARRENKCCPECKDAYNVEEVEQLKEEEEKKQNWGY
ncbi:UNVERIFIED_CONTAM: hypothetical protein FKN15_040136 [Acipenser sinensis]